MNLQNRLKSKAPESAKKNEAPIQVLPRVNLIICIGTNDAYVILFNKDIFFNKCSSNLPYKMSLFQNNLISLF